MVHEVTKPLILLWKVWHKFTICPFSKVVGRISLTPEKYIATVGFGIHVYPYKEKHYKDLAQAQFYALFVIVIGKLRFDRGGSLMQ